jgi:hypothetical protein
VPNQRRNPTPPGLVGLHRTSKDRWEYLGEVTRVRGLTARAARTAAVMAVTKGKAQRGETYSAVLRSEWRLSLDWAPPPDG